MHSKRFGRPSPAFVVAMIALFVALGGTAGAVTMAAVPLAKRALVADKAKVATLALNAQKLGGQSASQIASQAAQAPGPASTAAAVVSTKAQGAQLAPGGAQAYTISCDTGQKVLSGGFIADNAVIIAVGNGPVSETSWGIGLINLDSSAPANVNLYAICIK